MKKLLALLLALVMVIGMVACGNADAPADEPATTPKADAPAKEDAPAEAGKIYDGVTLTINTAIHVEEAADLAAWESTVAGFEEETGADVVINQYAYSDLTTVQNTSLIAGEAADILFISGGNEYDYVANGYLAEMDDLITADTSDWTFYDGKMVGGKHVVAPLLGGASPRVIWLNTDLAKEIGLEIPGENELTWDLLVDYSKKAIEAGYAGYAAPFSGNENAIISNYFNYCNQAGGLMSNEEGWWDFTSDAALEAMTFVYDIFNTHKIIESVSFDAQSAWDNWAAGETLFCNAGYGYMTSYLKENEEFYFGWEAYNLRGNVEAGFATADSLAINAASENKEAAADLIEHIMKPENYIKYLGGTTGNPLQTTVSSADLSQLKPANEKIAAFSNAANIDVVYYPPVAPYSAQIKEALQTHQQLCAMGEETPEEALAAVQAVVDSYK